MIMSKKILCFLCTGNSCRSQMAEGFGKKHFSNEYDVYSAGSEAHGLNANAVKAMREVDVDISTQTCDLIDRDVLNNADLVITLWGVAKDSCTTTTPQCRRWHGGVEDPAKAEGREEEKWGVFQMVRDKIEERIKEFAENNK